MNELTGAALDAAVAEAEGLQFKQIPGSDWGYIVGGETSGGKEGYPLAYSPSTLWAQGGPLIEREQIDLESSTDGWFAIATRAEEGEGWGDTPLVAAMRAYVASKRTTVPGPQSSNEGGTAG